MKNIPVYAIFLSVTLLIMACSKKSPMSKEELDRWLLARYGEIHPGLGFWSSSSEVSKGPFIYELAEGPILGAGPFVYKLADGRIITIDGYITKQGEFVDPSFDLSSLPDGAP